MGEPKMENQQTQNEVPGTNGAAKKSKTPLIIGGIVALLIVVAVVVVVVMQSQASQQAASNFPRLGGNAQGLNGQFGGVNGPDDAQGAGQGFGGPGGGRNFQFTPAKELPTTPADLNGVITAIYGESLMVGQRFGRGFRPGATPDAAQPTNTPAPDVEVIVTADTVIYQDTTPRPDFQNGSATPNAPVVMQQQVTLSALSALTANVRVTVWGTRSGNQITAKVIVFSSFTGRPQSPNGGTPTG
jgi:hypothetical protein